MRAPSPPVAVATVFGTGLFLIAGALLGHPATADPPERLGTVAPSEVRLETYEHLLHAQPPTYADPSGASNRDAWDAEHYRLALVPDFETHSIQGVMELRLRALEDGVRVIELDLYDELQVARVTSGTTGLKFVHANALLRITLDAALRTDEEIKLTVSYSGAPEPAGPLGLAFDTTPAGRPILATVSEPIYARSWWPCKDTALDKATVEVFATVPSNMFVASSGVLQDVSDLGATKQYHWASEYPMTTYSVSLSATEYASWTEDYVSPEGHEFPLEFHVFPEHEEIAHYEFGRVNQMIDYFSEVYGPYAFSDEKYGMAEVVLEGAMEHQTMTSYGDFFMTGDRYYEGIVAHELSHHWWGNLLTLEDWDDTWLHEGLATFSDGLWREHIEGRASYLHFLAQRAKNCCGFNGPISPPLDLFNQTVYQKGAWMLHMLRELVGDDLFFASLRSLTSNPELRYGHFNKDDFVAAFESTCNQELSWFFDQWLYRVGRPDIAVDWAPVAGSSQAPEVLVQVHQVQQDDVWTFPLRLRLELPSGPVDENVFMNTRDAEFVFQVPEWPTTIAIDPDQQLLHYDSGTERATAAPDYRAGTTQLLPNQPNPFNPRTSLRFTLGEPAAVRLRIFDLRGRVTRTIDCGLLDAGEHAQIWDGRDDDGSSVASGNYLVRLEGASATPPTQTVTLVR